ncbi:MAG: GHMP kinase, partial [Bacteroidota bacterium]
MTFHANGKLLLTGEYFVLDGALALALPVRLGQSLECQFVENEGSLTWQS